MRTAEDTIYSWNKMTIDKVLEEVKNSILHFEKAGLKLDEIKLIYAEENCKSDCLGEQSEKHEEKKD